MANLGSISALEAAVNAAIPDNTSNQVSPEDVRESIIDTIDTLTGSPVSSGKVYEAALTQTGTSAPVAVVFQNTTGRTITWSYDDVGNYTGTWSSSIDAANSGQLMGTPTPLDPQIAPAFASMSMSNSAVTVQTFTMAADGATDVTLTPANDCLSKTLIRIVIP